MSEKRLFPVVEGATFFGYSRVDYEKVPERFKERAKEITREIIGTIEISL